MLAKAGVEPVFMILRSVIDIISLASLKRRMPGFRWQTGFTMIELVVVLIMVGIMAVVALPKLTLLTGFKDVGYRDQIKSAVEYARKAAIWQRRYTCVVITSSAVTLTSDLIIPDSHVTDCTSGAQLANSLNLPSGKNTISPPRNVTASTATIQFNAQGQPWTGGATFGTSVTVTDSGSGSTSTLTIEADTGYVH